MTRLQIDNETWDTNLADNPDILPEPYLPDDIQELWDRYQESLEEQKKAEVDDSIGTQEEEDMLAFLSAPRVKPRLGSEDDRDEY